LLILTEKFGDVGIVQPKQQQPLAFQAMHRSTELHQQRLPRHLELPCHCPMFAKRTFTE